MVQLHLLCLMKMLHWLSALNMLAMLLNLQDGLIQTC
jgi:hypothetical protein